MACDKSGGSKDRCVSVVLISYNRHADLAETLSYINTHGGPELAEIVVVDNGSNPPISVPVATLPVKAIRLHRNMGVSFGRNVGAANARCPFLLFLDDDCTCEFIGLKGVIEYISSEERLCAVGLGVHNVGRSEALAGDFDKFRGKQLPFSWDGVFSGGGVVVKRAQYLARGGFEDDFFYSMEELDFAMRGLRAGLRFAYTENCVVLHYATPAARPTGRKVRQYYKNYLRVIWRYYPIDGALKQTLRTAVGGLIRGLIHWAYLPPCIAGVAAAIPACIKDWASGKRKPLDRDTFQSFERWYKEQHGVEVREGVLNGLKRVLRTAKGNEG
jgi:GT2 family glycosyltransferase